jgi:hypothetical protein
MQDPPPILAIGQQTLHILRVAADIHVTPPRPVRPYPRVYRLRMGVVPACRCERLISI